MSLESRIPRVSRASGFIPEGLFDNRVLTLRVRPTLPRTACSLAHDARPGSGEASVASTRSTAPAKSRHSVRLRASASPPESVIW